MRDLEMMHSSLQNVHKTLNLAPLGPLQSSRQMLNTPVSDEANHLDDAGPSCDNSPKISPADENDLPKVPIQSVYHLTKLSALRSPEATDTEHAPKQASDAIDDFISKGRLSLSDAERLFHLYIHQLDHFMYGIGGRYKTLDELRRRSRILTVSLLTVAALHDPDSHMVYGICSKEFRSLMAASLFSRRINHDYLRAMCIASYWLSDINWMLSGYAIRRAAELNLTSHYQRAITDGDEESAELIRLWYVVSFVAVPFQFCLCMTIKTSLRYILYICDQHLSTLFARQSVIREDMAIQGWEAFSQSPTANESDKRLVSQVALLDIIQKIRDLFGPDTGEPVPQVYLMQVASFSRQLDQWVGHWSVVLAGRYSSPPPPQGI